ncbi:hypothetical protein NN561_008180 [Cricetulus griseus]
MLHLTPGSNLSVPTVLRLYYPLCHPPPGPENPSIPGGLGKEGGRELLSGSKEVLAEAWRPEPVESTEAERGRGWNGAGKGREESGTRVHSLCVAGGPGQPPGLLEDEDGAGDVVCATLHLILRQPEELRPTVREAQGQVRATAAAAAVLGAGAASHDAAHEIGHRRFHPSEHIIPAPGSRWASRRRRPAEAQRRACRLRRVRGARGASRAAGARGSRSSVLQGGDTA